MIKTFILIGILCIPGVECLNFTEQNPKLYISLEQCLLEGKKLGNDMLKRMNNKNIPSTVRVYCKEIEQHGEYS